MKFDYGHGVHSWGWSEEGPDVTEGELVAESCNCPRCGERRMDWLVWREDEVRCASCGYQYNPE